MTPRIFIDELLTLAATGDTSRSPPVCVPIVWMDERSYPRMPGKRGT
jgi:hypothetical protein